LKFEYANSNDMQVVSEGFCVVFPNGDVVKLSSRSEMLTPFKPGSVTIAEPIHVTSSGELAWGLFQVETISKEVYKMTCIFEKTSSSLTGNSSIISDAEGSSWLLCHIQFSATVSG
jgi:hypothetical protein